MKKLNLLVLGFFLIQCTTDQGMKQKKLDPKPFHMEYFGEKISDPFHFMENDTDSLILDWYKHQTAYTEYQLDKIKNRGKILSKLNQNLLETKVSNIRVTNNGHYFYLKTVKGEESKSLFYKNGIDGEEVLLFNPRSTEKQELKDRIINYIQPSPKGNKIVLGLTKDDQEFSKMIILDRSSLKLASVIIENCAPSVTNGINWLPDETVFFMFILQT